MKKLSYFLSLALMAASCTNTEVYDKKIAELNDQIAKTNEQMMAMQQNLTSVDNNAKTNVDATGIAIVDLEILLKEYKGYIAASKQLESKIKRWDEDLKSKQLKLQEDYKGLERDAQFLKEEQVQAQAAEMQQRYNDIMKQEQEYYKQAADEERKLTAEVLKGVNAHLKQYAIDNGYKMILFTPVENSVFYAEDQINITETYISNLNEAYDNGFK